LDITDIKVEELTENPGALEKEALGVLKVVQQLSDELPTDDYALTLDSSGENVLFTGANAAASFPAIIRTLPLPLPESRPVAMISSVQMCLAWDSVQICALVSTPLRDDLREQLATAIQDLGSDPSLFALDRGIPDVEGDNVLDICLAELSKAQPDYTQCRASVLAAPALEALDPPPGVPDAINTGVLVVLEDLQLNDDVFGDPELTDLIGKLPPENFLIYDIVLPDDPVIGTYDEQRITESRAGLSPGVDQDPEFYLRAVIGAPLIGEAIIGIPPEGPEAVISNLWIGKSCLFRWRQCPYL
jgi:hypothetical protein